jgi:hypothetical protein
MQFKPTEDELSFFQSQYLCDPRPFVKDPLHEFAEEYHTRCDAYDDIICTGRRNGESVAASDEQAKLSNRNAQSVIREICDRTGITSRDLRSAISRYRNNRRRIKNE